MSERTVKIEIDLSAAVAAARTVMLIHKRFGAQEWSLPLHAVPDIVAAAAPVIEEQVREQVAEERRMLEGFVKVVAEYGADLCTVNERNVVLIGEALVTAARVIRESS